MVKYNVTSNVKKDIAEYSIKINPKIIARLKAGITEIIVKKKKYLDKNYTVKQLAADLETNTRYIASTMKIGFGMNFASYVNRCRVEAAMAIIKTNRHRKLKMEDIAYMVGFSNRQPFYAAFFKHYGLTPRQYKLMCIRRAKQKQNEKDKQ